MFQNRQIEIPPPHDFCRVTHVGSNWNNDLNAGPLNWNLNNSSTNTNRNIGTHSLCTIKENTISICLGSCQNINPNPNRLVAVGRTLVRCKGL